MCYFLIEQVLKPKRAYSGQKLTKLVSVKTTAIAMSTMPHVPLNVSLKNSIAKIAAKTKRMIRSAAPIFAFMFEVVRRSKHGATRSF
jgi:hypothetical protein